jgi:hypothetical protein
VVSYELNGAITTVFTEKVTEVVALSMPDWEVHGDLVLRWFC